MNIPIKAVTPNKKSKSHPRTQVHRYVVLHVQRLPIARGPDSHGLPIGQDLAPLAKQAVHHLVLGPPQLLSLQFLLGEQQLCRGEDTQPSSTQLTASSSPCTMHHHRSHPSPSQIPPLTVTDPTTHPTHDIPRHLHPSPYTVTDPTLNPTRDMPRLSHPPPLNPTPSQTFLSGGCNKRFVHLLVHPPLSGRLARQVPAERRDGRGEIVEVGVANPSSPPPPWSVLKDESCGGAGCKEAWRKLIRLPVGETPLRLQSSSKWPPHSF